MVAAQLSRPPGRSVVEPCDVTLATFAAAVAAMQSLAFLDGGSAPTIDGTLELTLPDWRLRRRSWIPHPACGCLAHAS